MGRREAARATHQECDFHCLFPTKGCGFDGIMHPKNSITRFETIFGKKSQK